jgi:hypothetical protein
LEARGAFFGEHASHDLEAMVEARVDSNAEHRGDGARLGIRASEDDPWHARQDESARAHRARLEGHIGRRALETPPADARCCGSYRKGLGVGRRIAETLARVSAAADYLPGRVDDDAADRHLTRSGCGVGLRKGEAHLGNVIEHGFLAICLIKR